MNTDVTIIGRYKQMKTFETPDDFNKYYIKHKDEIDAKTTNQLNKELKIPGFKITKRNMRIVDGKKIGDLHLKPIVDHTDEPENNPDIERLEGMIRRLSTDMDKLKSEVKMISKSLTEVIAVINSSD